MKCIDKHDQNDNKLKADRPHPHNYPHTPTDYKHTDKHLRLIITLVALCCTRQSRAQTDIQTDRRTNATKYIISLTLWSITTSRLSNRYETTRSIFYLPVEGFSCNHASWVFGQPPKTVFRFN